MKAEPLKSTPDNWLQFFLVLAMLAWPPIAFGASREPEQLALLINFLVVIAVISALNAIKGRARIAAFPFWPMLLLMGVAAAASTFNSIHIRESLHWMGMFAAYGFAFAWGGSLRGGRLVRAALYVLLAVAVFTAAYGIWRYVFGVDTIWGIPELSIYKGRLGGTFRCPNHAAAFWALLLPVAGYIAVRKAGVLRAAGAAAALVLLAAALLSYSRSGLLMLSAEVIVAVIIGVLLKKRSPVLKAAAMLAVIVLLAASALVVMRLQRDTESNELAWSESWEPGEGDASQVKRYGMLRDTLKMIPDRSMTGLGPGTFSVAYPAYRGEMIYTMASDSHNDYLQNAAEFGLPFSVLFIVFLIMIVASVYRRIAGGGGDAGESAALLPYLLAAIAGFGVVLALDFNLRIPGNAMAFFFIAGVACSLGAGDDAKEFQMSATVYRIACAALAVCAVLMIPTVYSWFGASRMGMESAAAEKREDAAGAIELLAGARERDPGNDVYAKRAAMLLYKKAKDAGDAEEMARASDLALEAAALNKYSGRALVTAARAEIFLGDNAAAEEHLLEAIRREPRNAGFMDNLVFHLVNWGRKDEALPWVKKSCYSFPLWRIHYYINLERWDPEIYAAAAEGLFQAWEERHEKNSMEALMKLAHDSLKNDDCTIPMKLKNQYEEYLRESLVKWTRNWCEKRPAKKK